MNYEGVFEFGEAVEVEESIDTVMNDEGVVES